MTKVGWVLLGALLFLLVFWVGLMLNFPGAALSRLIESKIAAHPALSAKLSPATLGWSGVNFQTLRLAYFRPEGRVPLIALNDVSISLTWRLWGGLPVSGSLGEQGRFEFFVPWEAGETFAVSGAELPLEDIPAISVFAPLEMQGRLTFSAEVEWPGVTGAKLRKLPAGSLIAKGEALQVRRLEILGAKLPQVKLESLELQITTGERITIDRFEFRGDVQGKLTGTLRPRLDDFSRTALELKLAASFRPEWLRQLGALEPLVQGFLKNGRLEGNVRGTVGQPRFKPGKGRT